VTVSRVRRSKQPLDDLKGKRILDIEKRKHYIALCEELGLKEAVDLSVRQTTENKLSLRMALPKSRNM